MTDESFDIIQKIHVRAPFRLIRAAAPYFRIKVSYALQVHAIRHLDLELNAVNVQGAHENRSIVNVSSVSGLHGNVGQLNYAAAKAAVVGMTKTIAKEWGIFGVRANTVAFGYIQTR